MGFTLKQLYVFSVLQMFVCICYYSFYFKSNNSFDEKIVNIELGLSFIEA